VEKGLSHNSVYSVFQDKRGYLWFGTQDGLNRYSGFEMTVFSYNQSDINSLSNNNISFVLEDSKENLWVGTWGGGLNLFDRKTAKVKRFLENSKIKGSIPSNRIAQIIESSNGILWIATGGGGLCRYDYASGNFISYNSGNSGLKNDRLWGIVEDLNQDIWISTDGGLYKFIFSKNRIVKVEINASDIVKNDLNLRCRSINCDKNGNIWVGSETGLNFIDKNGNAIAIDLRKGTDLIATKVIINCIYTDSSNNVWVGAYGEGLFRVTKNGEFIERFSNDPANAKSLSYNDVRTIYQDRSGNIWIGTRGGGVNKFNLMANHFDMIAHSALNPNSISSSNIRAILEDGDLLWIGTNDNGLNRINKKNGKVTRFIADPNNTNGLSNNRVTSVIKDNYDDLWFGTDGGLCLYNRQSESFKTFTHKADNLNSLSSSQIVSLAYDTKLDEIWVGTYGGGLTRFNPKESKFTHFKFSPNDSKTLSGNEVTSLLHDNEGYLWVGTLNGLNKIDVKSNSVQRFSHTSNDPGTIDENGVYSLHQSKNGLWIGTNTGLFFLKNNSNKFVKYTEKDGLPNDVIFGILEDKNERIWVSTNKGISNYEPSTFQFRNYNILDGIQGNVFNLGAYHQGKDGKLYFGGFNGVTSFIPEEIKVNTTPPPVVITLFRVFNVKRVKDKTPENLFELMPQNEIVLDYDENFFTIEFAALDFSNPFKNKYAYFLEGIDRDWVNSGVNRLATYTDLDPGTYIFTVKATNNDGVWNNKGVSLKITIVPPFWLSWWFISMAVLFIGGSAYSFLKLRLKSINLRQQNLEKLIKDRTKELEETNIELQEQISVRERMENIQTANYRVAEAIYESENLTSLFKEIHKIISSLMPTNNFYIALFDSNTNVVSFPYWADEFTHEVKSRSDRKGLTEFVLRNGTPIRLLKNDIHQLQLSGEVSEIGTPAEVWIGVPLNVYNKTVGIMAVQDYHNPDTIGEAEKEILFYMSEQVAVAVAKKRVEDEIKKALEKEKELNELRSRFISMASHEFKTPLTSIFSSAEIIENYFDRLTPEQRQRNLKRIYENIDQMNRLLNDILIYGKTESGRIKLDLRPENLKTNFDECTEHFTSTILHKTKHRFIVKEENIDRIILIDPKILRQIFENLFSNAIKYSPEGSEIFIDAICKDNNFHFEVRDQGIGIPEGDIPRLFDAFHRGSNVGSATGTGLGLVIVKTGVEMHNGTLEVKSVVNKGTTFIIDIPLITPENK
jgi:signal transduction histidine kinase/ligand-binding sensor domain-containing protein